MKNSNIRARAKYSVAGLRSAWTRERSFRTQVLLSAAILVALTWMQPSATWCAIIVLAIAGASALEVLNGSLETLIDHLHPVRHPQIAIAKDMASAAAFIANCATGLVFTIMSLTELF